MRTQHTALLTLGEWSLSELLQVFLDTRQVLQIRGFEPEVAPGGTWYTRIFHIDRAKIFGSTWVSNVFVFAVLCVGSAPRNYQHTADCSFNSGVMCTLLFFFLISVIRKTWIWPFVITNCSQNRHLCWISVISSIKTKGRNKLKAQHDMRARFSKTYPINDILIASKQQ
jgi:hypothetical protein